MSYKHPIDTTFITTQIGESREILTEMSKVFLEVLKEYQVSIQSAIQEQDFSAIRLHAHKIKPSLSMFGLSGILEMILIIEKAAHLEENLSKVIENVQKIEKELPLIYHQVSEIIEAQR